MQSVDKNNVKNALNEKQGFHVWWRMLRPHTLTASFIPVFTGTILAALDGDINYLLFAAMLIASILIQAATNMFNEYFDYVRGLDNEQSVGIGGTIVRDGIPPKTVKNLAYLFILISIVLGVYICMESSWWIGLIGLVCILFGYLYTGGPYPISRTPFGEISSGFFMGTVIVGISYYIQTGLINRETLLISVPIAIFIGTIMLSNNIRDFDGDKENGRKTLAILIGRNNAIKLLFWSFMVSYFITLIYMLIGLLPLFSVITFLSMGKAAEASRGFKHKKTNLEMNPAMKATAKTNTFYGLLLCISLIIELLIVNAL